MPYLVDVAQTHSHLCPKEKTHLKKLLFNYNDLFQSRSGKWQGKPVHINLIEDTSPTYSQPYRILQAHFSKLRKEIDRLVQLKFLTPTNDFYASNAVTSVINSSNPHPIPNIHLPIFTSQRHFLKKKY